MKSLRGFREYKTRLLCLKSSGGLVFFCRWVVLGLFCFVLFFLICKVKLLSRWAFTGSGGWHKKGNQSGGKDSKYPNLPMTNSGGTCVRYSAILCKSISFQSSRQKQVAAVGLYPAWANSLSERLGTHRRGASWLPALYRCGNTREKRSCVRIGNQAGSRSRKC